MKSSTLGAGGVSQDAKGEEKNQLIRVCFNSYLVLLLL